MPHPGQETPPHCGSTGFHSRRPPALPTSPWVDRLSFPTTSGTPHIPVGRNLFRLETSVGMNSDPQLNSNRGGALPTRGSGLPRLQLPDEVDEVAPRRHRHREDSPEPRPPARGSSRCDRGCGSGGPLPNRAHSAEETPSPDVNRHPCVPAKPRTSGRGRRRSGGRYDRSRAPASSPAGHRHGSARPVDDDAFQVCRRPFSQRAAGSKPRDPGASSSAA